LLQRERGYFHHLICGRLATEGTAETISSELFQQDCVQRGSAAQAIEIVPSLLANDLQLQAGGRRRRSITAG